ncbi:hypothetical protein AV926_00575 [Myroides marinus]|uniref:DNA polymerase-3 subunit gamma/tau n=1 Tax=Myroides marinus TaxID=703342 RepID=A0A161U7W2_9FLAO|nr:hypothetical protein [Myroides marinus]KZE81836.1 hypothetical protein AV926_00575 [Myroides marinus]
MTSGQFSNNTVLSGLSQVGNNHTQVDSQELSILQQTNTQVSAVENSIMPSQSTFAQVENEQYNAPATSIPSDEVSQAPLSSVITPANNVTGNETSGNEVPQPKRASALSLTSIRNRKELASSLEKNVINPDDLPKEPFTYDQLIGEWNYYMDRLLRGGLPLMASLMNMARPTLKGFQIELELPNAGSKLSFEENKYDLVNYLRKKLQNFDIELTIIVNEEIKLVKRVLDSKDKYQHFISINPEVEKLRDIFDLELK